MNNSKSKKAFEEALKYIPGGVDSPARAFKAIGIPPIFIKKAKGPHIYDIDGNKYLDFCLSWGAHILGHNHPQVVKAVTHAIKNGTSFGAATELETQLAKMIVNAVPSIEKVRFVNSGTEAAMSAIKLAKAYTNKSKIIKFIGCYHGFAEISDVEEIQFNDVNAVEEVFNKNKNKIAAVIVEPVPCNMGVILPKPEFLKFLRRITKDNNALLIFDEVITGFRLSLGGAQELFKIRPDLTCFGKIIGGGFPVGAFGGREDIMEMLAPSGPVYQAGTFSGNPVTMSAGIAALKTLSREDFYEKLDAKASDIISKLKEGLGQKKVIVSHIGSMFTVFFSERPINNHLDAIRCDIKRFAKFYREALGNGIYFSPSQFEANFISSAHRTFD